MSGKEQHENYISSINQENELITKIDWRIDSSKN